MADSFWSRAQEIPRFEIGYDIDAHKSSIAAEVEGHWYDTAATKDWPVFDHLFGRKAWQAFIAEHAEQAIAEVEADED